MCISLAKDDAASAKAPSAAEAFRKARKIAKDQIRFAQTKRASEDNVVGEDHA